MHDTFSVKRSLIQKTGMAVLSLVKVCKHKDLSV